MPLRENIYRLRALAILFVFGISLLPRQLVHNFFTNHKHLKYSGLPGQPQLSAETVTCSADDLFLQQSYTDTLYNVSSSCILPRFLTATKLISFHSNDDHKITALRGPPLFSTTV